MKTSSAFLGITALGVSLLPFGPACSPATIVSDGSGGSTAEPGSGGAAGSAQGGGGAAGSVEGSGGAGSVVIQIGDAASPDPPGPAVPTEDANCGLVPFDVSRKPANLLLVLDRSASMIEHEVTGASGAQVTRAQAAKEAVDTIIAQTESGIAWGLKMFPEGNDAYCVVTADEIDVPLALNNHAAIASVVNADAFDGDGTPTAAAVSAGHGYLRDQVSDDNPKYLILATDGEPSDSDKNQCTGQWAEPDVKTAAVNAVAAAASDGIKTFVIGVNTSSSSNVTLNRLVQAGLTADPPIAADEDVTSSKNTTRHYYAANDSQGLLDALGKIAIQVSDCTFPLSEAPPVPDNVVVKVTDASGQLVRVPVDASHNSGWDYAGTNQRAITVYGSWCEMVKAPTGNNRVSIIFGCPGQVIP
jgi:hypothetical protein